MKLLNERYDYGLNLVLLSVDEGITGYRDDSLETVKRNKVGYLATMDTVNIYQFCYIEVLSRQARNQSEYKALQKVMANGYFLLFGACALFHNLIYILLFRNNMLCR